MTSLRVDPLTGRPSLISPERDARPVNNDASSCPFCPGNELSAGEETGTVEGTDGWAARSIKNKYPMTVEDAVDPGARGRCEVVLTSPRHELSMHTASCDELADGLQLIFERVNVLAASFASTFAFCNSSLASGGSQAHPHSQVVAVDAPSPVVQAERSAFRDRPCPICDRSHDTTVAAGAVAAWCAPAPLFGYEVLVAPERHGPSWDDSDVEPFAAALGPVLRAVVALSGPDYNIVWHSDMPGTPFHRHAHVYPRHRTFGGMELASGITSGSTTPEAAAADLRRLL